MAFDELLEYVGKATPAHRCYVQLLDNLTSEANITVNLTAEALLRVSIPMDLNQKPEQCRRFRQTQWQLLNSNVSTTNNIDLETEPCLDGWIYDQSVFTSTIRTEWNLVCEYQSFKSFAQAIYMAGFLVGSPLCGFLSDRVGRKPLLLFCCLACGILGTCCAFAPMFSIYCALRFLFSACMGTVQFNSLILLLEGTSPKWHPTIITVFGLSMSMGQVLLGGLAYMFRDWHILQLVVSLPYFIFSLFFCVVSESVRWLIATGQTERALKELKRIAYINGNKDVAQSLTTEILTYKMKEELNTSEKQFKIKEIIVNPTVCRIVLCGSFLGFSGVFSSHGLMLDVQSLGDDIFLSQFLLGVVEFPSKLLTFFVIRHVGRRPSTTVSFLVAGSCIVVNIFVSKDMATLRLIIFLLVKTSLASFVMIYIAFSNELVPTTLRLTLQSIFNLTTRSAAIFSALVLATRSYFVHLPMILFGIFPIAASICVYFLPETFNLPLPDTIEDMEKRDRFRNKGTREKQRKVFLETTEC
uniref:Major facilitator superfamily (MFS) profile domain-containing protein n=1 Tax=Oryctolagus cuniculus TaxID=9986 RepID=G1U7X0_RABIT